MGIAAPLAFAGIEPVDLSRLALVTPWMDEIVGVPNLDSVIVLLLFIGSSCVECALWLNTLITFYNRANMLGKQIEVVLISAHKTYAEYSKVVFGNINNPFLAVKYHSYEKQALLSQFNINYNSDGSFKPRLHIMEWLGARSEIPLGKARVCSVLKSPFSFIEALRLKPMIRPIRNRSKREVHYSDEDLAAVDPEYEYSPFSNDWRYAPVDRVQTMRESCNYLFSELQDTLFALATSKSEQMEFLNLAENVSENKSLISEAETRQRITKYALNYKLLDLLEKANLEYFCALIHRLKIRSESSPFPRLSKTAPGDPRFLIKIYYRTREWTAVREEYPRNFQELKSLVAFKVPDINFATAKFFSDELNPRLKSDEDESCPAGITERFGTLNEMENFSDRMMDLIRTNASSGLVKIRVVVIDGQTRIEDPSPCLDKAMAMDQIECMIQEAESQQLNSFGSVKCLLSMAIVLKLTDVMEFQCEALRRMPVSGLHKEAVTQVLSKRKSGDFNANYSEELLKQLVAWFNEKLFSWMPARIFCQADPDCRGSMHVYATSQCSSGDEKEKSMFLDDVIVEKFTCSLCEGEYRHTRPVHDLMKMMDFTQGRCGEHAKVFALLAKALGFDVRLVFGWFKSRHLSTRPLVGDSDLDHMWNEVFIKDRWMHVDPSATDNANLKDAGAMDVPRSARFACPQTYETCSGRLLSAVAASSDYASVVTNRYLLSPESALFAKEAKHDKGISKKVRILSDIVSRCRVASQASSPKKRRFYLIKHLSSHDALPAKRWPGAADPRFGLGDEFDGPSSLRIKIEGREIPDYLQRPKSSMFSSYGKLRSLDGTRWRVCVVEVLKIETGLVGRVRFGYCCGREEIPCLTSSSQVTDGWKMDEEPFKEMPPFQSLLQVPMNDHVGRVDIEFSQTGLLSEFRPQLYSSMPSEELLQPVIGFYGSHKPGEGIDSLGLYLATSFSGPVSPLIGFNRQRAPSIDI